ncbi:MAG TPA: hypothetical protein VK989_14155, partial [Polyangia bacterium]|nr:hypothetical protein [Polyangia bacterium]
MGVSRGARAGTLVVAALLAHACVAARSSAPRETPGPGARGHGHVASNIVRDDYAGSARCEPCHR